MLEHRISDWDDAYANGSNIARGDRWPEAWVKPAEAFRNALSSAGRAKLDLAYGDRPRNRMDLFLPDGSPKGLVVFVHGGYWLQLDKSFWSHLAAGPWSTAMPSRCRPTRSARRSALPGSSRRSPPPSARQRNASRVP